MKWKHREGEFVLWGTEKVFIKCTFFGVCVPGPSSSFSSFLDSATAYSLVICVCLKRINQLIFKQDTQEMHKKRLYSIFKLLIDGMIR